MHNSILKCKACKNKFPYEEITGNNGFCNDCITHTTICECGCGTLMFAYTASGKLRHFLNQTHANKAINDSIRARMEDPEYAEKLSKIRSDAASKMYEERPELIEQRRQETLERYEDPEEHEKTSEQLRERWSNPEEREKQRQRQLKFMEEHPEITELRKYASKEYWQSEEAREQQSLRKTELFKDRSNHPRWEGGISVDPYDEEWNKRFKTYIRERQNNICADYEFGNCSKDRELSVHHINRIKTESTSENCIALCQRHHAKSHNEEARIRHREFVRRLMESE